MPLTHWLLYNAVAATLLAALAALVSWRLRSRPALCHGLWLLVFVKLLTPPVIGVPLPWPTGDTEKAEEGASVPLSCPAALPDDLPLVAAAFVVVAPSPQHQHSDMEAPPTSPENATSNWDAKLFLSWLWLCGVAVFAIRAAWRLLLLSRLLRRLPSAPPELAAQVEALSRQLGLRTAPRVCLTESSLPPLVVALGRQATLIFPLGLWRRLDAGQRAAVILHELAHLRRGDHRVRVLELVALTVYWWFPIAWWASYRLRQAEENCCDAWVVWAQPEARPAYAAALVETVAFLSEGPVALPAVASGAGPIVYLKRRLSMILEGKTSRGLSRAGWLVVLACLSVLPLMPTLAQDSHPAAASSADLRPALADQVLTEALKTKACLNCHQSNVTKQKPFAEKTTPQLHDRIVELIDKLQAQRKQVKQTELKLQQLLEEFERSQEKPRTRPKDVDRQQQLEDKLEQLLREVEGLRREIRRTSPPARNREKPANSEQFVYVNTRSFSLPIKIHPGAEPKNFWLFSRLKDETSWKRLDDSTQKHRDAFTVTVAKDGTYYFALIAEDEIIPNTVEPNLVVVVDTVKPVITGELSHHSNSRSTVRWNIQDPNLDPESIKGYVRFEQSDPWIPLPLKSVAVGEYVERYLTPPIEVRITARDKAGNQAEATIKPPTPRKPIAR